MTYQPTKNIKKPAIVKDSAIDRNKGQLAGKIGYWLYRLLRLFKGVIREPNPQFLLLCGKLPIRQKKHYWNKAGIECVDFDVNGFHLIMGYSQGYLLLRLHDKKQNIDKSLRLNPSNKGLQDVLGTINSMQGSLVDRIKKVA